MRDSCFFDEILRTLEKVPILRDTTIPETCNSGKNDKKYFFM